MRGRRRAMAELEQEVPDEVEQELQRQIRTSKALQAMEMQLHLSTAVVMPVLLKLIKTYEGNWEHIEYNHYEVLADMIFQEQEAEETEKAPGSSSGRKNGKKKVVPAMRSGTARRAPRNSKKLESDDSEEDDDRAQELIRRSRRVPAEAFTHAAGMATLERAVVAKRSRVAIVRSSGGDDNDDDHAWEPPLALPSPVSRNPPPQQCQSPRSGGGRRELRRLSIGAQSVQVATGASKQTQTEAAVFEALAHQELFQPTAIVCYEEPVPAIAQQAILQPLAVVKREDAEAPVFLPAAEVRRQILNRTALISAPVPCKTLSGEICTKCEKPKLSVTPAVAAETLNRAVSDTSLKSLVFDPANVKIEGQVSSKRTTDPPLMCLNPEPLQVKVPTSPQPGALAFREPPAERFGVMEALTPEPLLLTFPSEAPADEGVGAGTDQVPKVSVPVPCSMKALVADLPKVVVPVPCSVKAPIADLPKVVVPVPCSVKAPVAEMPTSLVPCSVNAPIEMAVQADTNVGLSSEPKEKPSEVVPVENTVIKEKEEVGRFSKADVEVKKAESSTKVDSGVKRKLRKTFQQAMATENSITEGALAALASYISESDIEDTDMSPQLESRVSVEGVKGVEGVELGKGAAHEEPPGILPPANMSSIAVIADASSRVGNLPEKSRNINTNILPGEVGEVARNTKDSEMITLNVAPNDATVAQSPDVTIVERKQSSESNTSSESSKKRKRTLIKKHRPEQEEQEGMTEKRSLRYDREDISRGKEKVPISLSAPVGEDLPADFLYINASVVFQHAHIEISMSRIGEEDRCTTCVGNCLDNPTPCECARSTGGDFAYTVEGHLYPHFLKQELESKGKTESLAFCQPGACPIERTSEEPCKGHIQRRFIKECWEKCGCSMFCGNRIVQRGISQRLQVFWTEGGKGWGVRTLEHLPAGTFVCQYVGEILTNTEMWNRNKEVHRTAKHTFALQLDADWKTEEILNDEDALCLDGTYYGNVSRFINHRCIDSNLFDIPVQIECTDRHYYHLAFFTSKDVNENEELTWDYGLDFSDKDHQIHAFECFCGSSFCRGKIEDHGKPWV